MQYTYLAGVYYTIKEAQCIYILFGISNYYRSWKNNYLKISTAKVACGK